MADDAERGVCSGGEIYQLRVVIGGISPLIWRRLLVAADTTIAELHTILQAMFGWSGEHLHRFVIHGTEYGIFYVGGRCFRDDARTVCLEDLGLRLGERFSYEYNYFAAWTCQLRLEQIAPATPGRSYPRCVGGRRAGPPEEWNGPWEFQARTQPHLVFAAALRAAKIVGQFLDAAEDAIVADVLGEYHDELGALMPLLGLDRFDRRACNTALASSVAAMKESGV